MRQAAPGERVKWLQDTLNITKPAWIHVYLCLAQSDAAPTLDGVWRLGHSSLLVQDLHLQAAQHGPIEPVPDQEGAVPSV